MRLVKSRAVVYAVFLSLIVAIAVSSFAQVKPSSQFKKTEGIKAGNYDNGRMWAFDFLPTEYLSKTYNFNPPKEWFEKARLSAVRLSGCSGSFVSEDGLVMTNHHCARSAVEAVSMHGENLLDDGFYAATLDEERVIPNAYIDQLIAIEDVTKQVQDAFNTGTGDDERVAKRTAKIAEIEKTQSDASKLTCKVVTFFNGGRYSLYSYKRYKDIRLVFAVETAIGFYGGDPDNFTYPRYDLDCAFYRVYEDGKPLKTQNFFKWSANGANDGELTFVIGNPGRTSRLATFAQLEFMRDVQYPASMDLLDAMVDVYSSYVKKHPGDRTKYLNTLFGYQNSQKSYRGRLEGLNDCCLMSRKLDFEETFKAKVMANPELKKKYGTVWNEIAKHQKQKAIIYSEYNALNPSTKGRSTLFNNAFKLMEFARQMQKPEANRDQAYVGTKLDSTKEKLTVWKDNSELEQMILERQLEMMGRSLGKNHKPLATLIGSKDAATAAEEIMKSTILLNKEKVKKLVEQGADAILKSSDPLLVFVASIDSRFKQLRDEYRAIGARDTAKLQLLGLAFYEIFGTSLSPDATFTLRLADGVVKGYEYNGTIAPPYTTFAGMYDRYYSFGKKDPWSLPDRWKNPTLELLSTPINFVSTNDIIGGNSGSPVVNKNLEIVGLVFDGNIESLPGDLIFIDTKNRTVAVHSAGILGALKHIYKAGRIASELENGKIVQ
jgi:hypothetical protein